MAKIITAGFSAILIRPRLSRNGNRYYSVKAKNFVKRYDKDAGLSDDGNRQKCLDLFLTERGWDYPNGVWVQGTIGEDTVYTFMHINMLEGL